jgi:putative ubiquitin-RnfH superfamily antitoxin RatB of RatAB toxin-antitoxin module
MEHEGMIVVEVVCAWRERQIVIELSVPAGTSVRAALELPHVRERVGISDDAQVGIYGRVVTRETTLRNGDRVEIYRPLMADPKQARRRRAGGSGRD